MSAPGRKKKIPNLKYAAYRGIGWHVSYRDPITGVPRKQRFRVETRKEALRLYHEWLGSYLKGVIPAAQGERTRRSKSTEYALLSPDLTGTQVDAAVGCFLHIVSELLRYEESRVREEGAPRQKGTIARQLNEERRHYAKEFLGFLNSRHGDNAVFSMLITDLKMDDVEAYNQFLVTSGYSSSQVTKRMLFAKTIVSRAGRPEYGTQVLSWNWDSLDLLQGKPTEHRQLPTLNQMKLILRNCDLRETAMVWIAIGCGFGQKDLSAIRVNQFDQSHYDLRRGKMGIDRHGETPKLVWSAITEYLQSVERNPADLMFVTRKGFPLVHNNTNTITQWWGKLRNRLGDECKSLDGFYILRHLGATEYGSRKGCSASDMKRWLGPSASSRIADVYMKTMTPENKAIVSWVRKSLSSEKADL